MLNWTFATRLGLNSSCITSLPEDERELSHRAHVGLHLRPHVFSHASSEYKCIMAPVHTGFSLACFSDLHAISAFSKSGWKVSNIMKNYAWYVAWPKLDRRRNQQPMRQFQAIKISIVRTPETANECESKTNFVLADFLAWKTFTVSEQFFSERSFSIGSYATLPSRCSWI